MIYFRTLMMVIQKQYGTFRTVHWCAALLMAVISGQTALAASTPSTAEICKGTWANCALAVKQDLEKGPQDPKAVVELANLWATAYEKQYEWLRVKGRLQQSTPDSEKIFEAVKSKLDPVDIVADKLKDKAVDGLINRYFARLAPLVKFAGGPIGEALKAFFNSSEIATDYDELRLTNDDIQKRIAQLLQPYLKPNWQSLLDTAAQQATPSIKQR